MPLIRILSAAAVILPAAIGIVPASSLAQGTSCGWYADTALKQQQQNEQRGCGFNGPAWSMSRQAHLSWCTGQSPERWKSEAQSRERMLAGCKK